MAVALASLQRDELKRRVYQNGNGISERRNILGKVRADVYDDLIPALCAFGRSYSLPNGWLVGHYRADCEASGSSASTPNPRGLA